VLRPKRSLSLPILLVLALSAGPTGLAAAGERRTSARPPDAPAAPAPSDHAPASEPASSDDAPAPGPDASAPVGEPTTADVSAPPSGALAPAGSDANGARPDWGPLGFLGDVVPPGEARRLRFESLDSFTAGLVAMRGVAPGPTLCITAGVHGDELNGIAIARQLVDETDPRALAGTLIVVPIVNAYGFRSGSRYLPDRRDLNRYFPGRPEGSAAARIAHQFFEQVVRRCDELVDLHTGSLNRANVPQIRTDLSQIENLRLAWGFTTEHVIHSVAQPGTLRRAANDAGIAAVLYEAGEPGRIDQEEIERGVAALRAVMSSLGMLQSHTVTPVAQRLYARAQWVRADASGIYVPLVELGQPVEPGQRLAEVTDPFSSQRYEIVSPVAGRVIGMALGQVVIPGFALFHIGIEDTAMPVAGNGEVALPPANLDDSGEDDDPPLARELAEERPE
jgi:predicted deacylase